MKSPPAKPLFPALDGVRALAIGLVFVFHGATGRFLAEHANVGVTLFFVLSGFLLYRPFVVGRNNEFTPSVARYFRRRALRILPAYWVALTIICVATTFPDDAWRTYLFLQAYSAHTVFDGIPGAWSLCVEVAFYISLPLYAVLVARAELSFRRELALLAALALGSIGFKIILGPTDVLAYATLPGTFAWFAAGMALARVSVERPAAIIRLRPSALWGGAIAMYLLISVVAPPAKVPFDPVASPSVPLGWQDIVVYLGSGVFGLCIVAFAVRPFGNQALQWPPLAALGLISYGVFLWHQEMISFASTHLSELPGEVWLALAGLASVVLAAISFYLLERPVMRASSVRNRLWLRDLLSRS